MRGNKSLVSYCDVKQEWKRRTVYKSAKHDERNGLARFRFENWELKEIRKGIEEERSPCVMKMKMRCIRYL